MKLKKKDIKALKRIKKLCKKQTYCHNCPLFHDDNYCIFGIEAPCDLEIKELTND